MIEINGRLAASGGEEGFTVRGGFEDLAASYDSKALQYFFDGARELIGELEMVGVESVLDLGTGTGHTALEIALRYPNCRVVGVDSSPAMLRMAERKKGGLRNVRFAMHDWEELEQLEGTFDLVTNSFGACLVKDLERFAASVASKVRQNGVFAFVNFADGTFEPFGAELVSDLTRISPLSRPLLPFAHTNGKLAQLMAVNGIRIQKTDERLLEYPLEGPEHWWTVVSRTAFSDVLYDLTEKEREAFKRAHLENIQRQIDKGCDKLLVALTMVIGKAESCSH